MDSRDLPAEISEENIDVAALCRRSRFSLLSRLRHYCFTFYRINNSLFAPADFLTKIFNILLTII